MWDTGFWGSTGDLNAEAFGGAKCILLPFGIPRIPVDLEGKCSACGRSRTILPPRLPENSKTSSFGNLSFVKETEIN